MKIEHKLGDNKTTIGKLCYGDVFDYDGNHMMKIKNNIDTGRSIDTDRFYNAVRLTDGTLYIISADALVTPLPNAKLVIE
jgi:hypothetical protein